MSGIKEKKVKEINPTLEIPQIGFVCYYIAGFEIERHSTNCRRTRHR